MVSVDPLACWTASSLLNATGVVGAMRVLDVIRSRRYGSLAWLLPSIVVSAWLESAFHPDGGGHAQYRHMAQDVAMFLVLAGVLTLLRHYWQKRSRALLPKRAVLGRDLRGAIEGFLESADKGDGATVVSSYDPRFLCARLADRGGLVTLTHDQMVSIWNRPNGRNPSGGHSIPTRDTVIHYAEEMDDTGFVLLTRMKDLGNGWEPMFYNLVWRKQQDHWLLLREFVHQRTLPGRL